jgi:hypothetical protein
MAAFTIPLSLPSVNNVSTRALLKWLLIAFVLYTGAKVLMKWILYPKLLSPLRRLPQAPVRQKTDVPSEP